MSFGQELYLGMVVVSMAAFLVALAWARLITGPHKESGDS